MSDAHTAVQGGQYSPFFNAAFYFQPEKMSDAHAAAHCRARRPVLSIQCCFQPTAKAVCSIHRSPFNAALYYQPEQMSLAVFNAPHFTLLTAFYL